jgi:hypothetical protein
MLTIDLKQMSREEKLRVMHALWEDLARDEDAVNSPEWHQQALRETEERMRSGTESIHDWEHAKSELRRRAG